MKGDVPPFIPDKIYLVVSDEVPSQDREVHIGFDHLEGVGLAPNADLEVFIPITLTLLEPLTTFRWRFGSHLSPGSGGKAVNWLPLSTRQWHEAGIKDVWAKINTLFTFGAEHRYVGR